MNNTFINIIYLGGIILSYNIGLYTNRLYHKYNNFINTKYNVLRLQELENDNDNDNIQNQPTAKQFNSSLLLKTPISKAQDSSQIPAVTPQTPTPIRKAMRSLSGNRHNYGLKEISNNLDFLTNNSVVPKVFKAKKTLNLSDQVIISSVMDEKENSKP